MDVITILRNKISELIEKQNSVIDLAVKGDKNARALLKAYQARICYVQNTIMELQGLGETVMLNELENNSKYFE